MQLCFLLSVRIMLLFILLNSTHCYSQIKGEVRDRTSKESIYGVKIISSENQRTISDTEGKFSLNVQNYPVWLYFASSEYYRDTVFIEKKQNHLKVHLNSKFQELQTLVVSANKRLQELEEVSISMEVIKLDMVEDKGLVNLEQVVQQSPGVYAMDGQVSIRGGGGYAYGVGSRVLVLTNGIPLISPDLGDAKWNSIPLESMSQIEITKGTSSVLYGSGALNGTISLRTREPSSDGSLNVKFQSGVYDNPKRESLKWWDRNPMSYELSIYNSKMLNQWGYTIAAEGYKNEGYKDGETESRARLSGSLTYKPEKFPNLKFDLNYSGQIEGLGKFILWESDSLAYTPAGGTTEDPSDNSLTYEKSIRLNIDPSFKYLGKKNNKHEVKLRYYLVTIGGSNSYFEASQAEMFYGDYTFQKHWGTAHNVTTGLTASYNTVKSSVFGDHLSRNVAGYGQYEFHKKRFDYSLGARLEYFQQDSLKPDSNFDFGDTTMSIPIYPIIRTAAHYKLTKSTHLRASFGQGVRVPSVSERYTSTSNGGIYIFPNPALRPERGWAAEIGVKQVFRIGQWKGIFDVAGFINHYYNMIEFAFGIYNPDTIALNLTPGTPGYIFNWVGFKAQNAEEAQITGVEFSFNCEGKIKNVELQSLIGYTYMEPKSLNTDPSYTNTFSDSGTTLLKYRFNHLFRFDLEATFHNISLGASSRYNSYMSNIDNIFESNIFGTEILPGLKDYRLENQTGSLVFDSRLSYKIKDKYTIGFIVNNILNAEYSSRPADIQPPRQYLVQLKFTI
jgi:iron complex outermembrane receptor protein